MLTNVCMYSTWLYSDLEYNCCCCLWAFTVMFCLHACKNAYQYLQSHLMLTNMCIHLLLHTHSHTINWQAYCVHCIHVICTHSFILMPYLHTPWYSRFSGISPCWSCKTLLSKMLTAIGTHTGSLSCILIWYCCNFLYTIGMCHMLHAYLCYVWLL